jgi:hypothetical protein
LLLVLTGQWDRIGRQRIVKAVLDMTGDQRTLALMLTGNAVNICTVNKHLSKL